MRSATKRKDTEKEKDLQKVDFGGTDDSTEADNLLSVEIEESQDQMVNAEDVQDETISKKEISTISMIMAVNFVGSISIVMCNKVLYSSGSGTSVPPMFLASFQFLCTFWGVVSLFALRLYKVKWISIWRVLPLSAVFCFSIIFANLSLKYNTVGTYQIIKCFGDPCTFFIQFQFYGQKFTRNIKLAMIIIVIGIFLTYFTAVELNVVGGIYGLIGVVSTSLYCTWVGTKQEELDLSPVQLLFYQSSLSSALLLLPVAAFESHQLFHLAKTVESRTLEIFVFSGFLAFLVNISVFFIIRRTSVVTYAVFCKLKVCLVIIGGYVLFQETMTSTQIVGVLLTLAGTTLYTKTKLDKSARVAVKQAKQVNDGVTSDKSTRAST